MEKKILLDAHVFDDKHQGTRTYLKGLYAELIIIAKDWHFFLAANDIANLKTEFGIHKNVTYIPLKSQNKFYRLLVELPLLIKEYKIDYAHYQYICPPIKNCKLIITTHDILFEQKEYKKYFPLKYRIINGFLFKWSAKRADLLLTVSQYSKDKISELYHIEDDKIKITPNAVSLNYDPDVYYQDLNKENLGKYLLYVSRVEPRKNHLGLLKVFIELNLFQKGYKLVFIGKKDIAYPELDNYIENNLNLVEDSVVWLSSISNRELKTYYQNCELFVFPSFAEGFGIPPLEAMALRRKILCSKSTAMADFDLPDSLIFDPNNLEELKQKILNQLQSTNVQLEVYSKVLNKYNWKEIAADYYKHLKTLNNKFNNVD